MAIKDSGRGDVCLLSLLILGGFFLRSYKWLDYSFWYDEVMWFFAGNSNASIKGFSIYAFKPPLFTVFALLWKQIASSELFLRLPSLVFGLLAVLLTYKITISLFDRNTALSAAFLIAFSPLHIYYSQEFNYYALTVLSTLFSMYFFATCLKNNKTNLWIKYIVATSVCIYTNYMCLSLLFVQNLCFFLFFLREKALVKRWALVQAALVILLAPLAGIFFSSISVIKNSEDIIFHWFPAGNWKFIIQTFNVFNLGYHTTGLVRLIGLFLFVSLFLRGVIASRRNKLVLSLLMLWLFVPILFSIIMAKVAHVNTYTHRNFIFSSTPYYMLIAAGLSKLSRRHFAPLLLTASVLFYFSLKNYYHNIFFTPEEIFRTGIHLKIDNRSATNYIMDNLEDADTVIHTCRNTEAPFYYYASLRNNMAPALLDEYGRKSHYIKGVGWIRDFVTGHKRLWLVFSHWEPEVLASPDSEERRIKVSLDRAYPLLQEKEFEGIKVYLYNINRQEALGEEGE